MRKPVEIFSSTSPDLSTDARAVTCYNCKHLLYSGELCNCMQDITRIALGNRMQNWHNGMNDPIYAVGSFYVDGKVYPNEKVVQEAITSFVEMIQKYAKMLAGEKVSEWNFHYQRRIPDLRKFAGYTDEDLVELLVDLKDIHTKLEKFYSMDY